MPTPKVPSFRRARAAAKLTMRGLAAAAAISLRTVARCEKADRWPVHYDQRQRAMAALGVQ